MKKQSGLLPLKDICRENPSFNLPGPSAPGFILRSGVPPVMATYEPVSSALMETFDQARVFRLKLLYPEASCPPAENTTT
ncbi:hypothetical protein [Larkinella soli]|uniref:hypothetical protein n=1 Tax=Larkinella soli TaxID=1770527 RepID=UPI000FFC94BE|nr:hypothetical protein [Larkinella soli]